MLKTLSRAGVLATAFALITSSAFASGQSCESVFKAQELNSFQDLFENWQYRQTRLDDLIPASAWKGSLAERTQQFLAKYPDNAAVVKDVAFKYEAPNEIPLVGNRDVLVISTANAPESLMADYFNFLSLGTISFPLSRGGGHLRTRFGTNTFDIISALNQSPYSKPDGFRIETVFELTPSEFANMAEYIANVKADKTGVIGAFSYEGSQQSRGKVNDNLCLIGGHNCTSWMATSGVGKNGERLLELAGGSLDHIVGTNPGWWSLFLNTMGKKERIPFSVFWTNSSLRESLDREVVSGEQIHTLNNGVVAPWDFSPH